MRADSVTRPKVGWVLLFAGLACLGARQPEPSSQQIAAPHGGGLLQFSRAYIAPVGQPLPGTIDQPTYQAPEATLRQLVQIAYGTTPPRIVGGPAWMATTRWRVVAKATDVAAWSDVRQMLRNLLAERFALRVDLAARPLSAVVMTADDRLPHPGLKLARTKVDCAPYITERVREPPVNAQRFPLCGPAMLETTAEPVVIHYRSASLSRIAHELEKDLLMPIILTSVKQGLFDVDFRTPTGFTLDSGSPDVDAFIAALRQQLGVSIAVRTLNVDVVSVVSAVPTATPVK